MKSNLAKSVRNGVLLARKHSPDILLGVGVTGVIASTVLACRATLKAQKVKAHTQNELETIESLLEKEKLSPEDAVRSQTYTAVAGAVDIVRLYVPPVAIGALSVAALVQSRNILTKRTVGLAAAYKLTEEAYTRYRERVIDELGEDVDLYIRNDNEQLDRELTVKTIDDKGKEEDFEMNVEEAHIFEIGASQYAKYFDASSPQWQNSNEQNIFFLKAQQTHMNVLLRTRGHVFLNEVYDCLGLPRTKAGTIVGWVDGHGDSVIDFGIFGDANEYNRDFVNGYDRDAILLDFNVDGVIWEMIWLDLLVYGPEEKFEAVNKDPDLYVYDQGYILKKPKKGELNYERESWTAAYDE